MKVLVAGSAGMLAKDLIPYLASQGHQVDAPSESDLDILDVGAIRSAIARGKPAVLINCAAYTNVDGAEKEEHKASLINGVAVQNLCLACQESDIALVHFSTDYVFDGTKEGGYGIIDPVNPINAYGRSKLLGELYITWLLRKFYLIRTSWLFGVHGRNFLETMLRLGRGEAPLNVVNDQRGCPTWTVDLSHAVNDLIESGRYGVYHVTNSVPTTWFDFAVEILRSAGIDKKVCPVSTDQFPRPARRPANSTLDHFPLRETIGHLLPPWQEAVQGYLKQRERLARA